MRLRTPKEVAPTNTETYEDVYKHYGLEGGDLGTVTSVERGVHVIVDWDRKGHSDVGGWNESYLEKVASPLTIGDNVGIEHRDWPDRKGTVIGFNPATGKYQVRLWHLYPGDPEGGKALWLGRGALTFRSEHPAGSPSLPRGPLTRTLRIEIPLDPDDIPDLADPQWLIEVLAERHAEATATIWKDPIR